VSYSAQITLGNSASRFEVRPGQTLLDAALQAGVDLPHQCRVGACGSCLVEVLEGRFHCRVDVGAVAFNGDPSQRLALACQTVARSDLTLALMGLHTAGI